jgi:hypothetical protein
MSSITSTPFAARRKKQAVYGRSSKPNDVGNLAFFEDDETPWAAVTRGPKKQTTFAQTHRNKAASPPRAQLPDSPAKKRGALPTVKTQSKPREKDTFDVPSDDDETTEIFSNIPVPPKQHIKSRLLDEPKEEVVQLAPWEKKATRKGNLPSTAVTRATRSKTTENVVGEKLSDKKRGERGSEKALANETQQAQEEQGSQEPVALTAMERLAARRRQVPASGSDNGEGTSKDSPKRVAVKANTQGAPQHKRRRMTPQPTSPPANVSATDSKSATMPNVATTDEATSTNSGDIFDVPSDEPTQPAKSAKAKAPRVRQRPRVPGGLRKVTPQKGLSAPARLQDMIDDDDEFAFPSTESPPSAKPRTPQTALRDSSKDLPSTPISSRSSTSHGHRPEALTPKQTQLWAELLEPTVVPDTGMKKLSITEDTMKSKPVHRVPALLQRSSSDVPVKRTRVIDRLKASAPNSSDEDESQDEDDEMEVDKPSLDKPAVQSTVAAEVASQATHGLSQTNQSQDRPTKATASGSLITYAKQRSHLADDNLENALMFDLPMVVPERAAASAKRVGRPAAARMISRDVDELDEAPVAVPRTIDELRETGRNVRMMGEIEALLGEVADHAASARSRRRGALLDLSTKLMDQKFAEQIFRHGHESTLLAECKTFTDAPSDFLLVTIVVLMLHAEPPSQSLSSFEEALPCIGRLLMRSSDIARVVKERQSNMSKSAQGDLTAFSNTLKVHEALWGESQPSVITSRIVALKAIELIVRKLRATGDKSALLDAESLTLLLPKGGFTGLQANAGKAFEASLVISILEALKTLSVAGSWPDSCITSVATLPAIIAEEWQVPSDTKWVAYRLCANITDDSTLTQAAFVEHDAVRHIMAEIVNGFDLLHNPPTTASATEVNAKRDFDILVLAIGAIMNLAEHSAVAQKQAVHETAAPSMAAIVHVFVEGQKRVLEAESVEQMEVNVVYGYLAIMLANICQDEEARKFVRGLLPGGKLHVLVAAVQEFAQHHQQAGAQQESGDTEEQWGGFTEKLLGVLAKLKAAERDGE